MAGQTFTFDSSQTIGDLLNVAEQLKATGHRPSLRLVNSYSGKFESIAVDVEENAPSREMAVTEGAES